MKPNCEIVQQQLDWLRSIKPTAMEKQRAHSDMWLFGGFSKDYENNKNIVTGKIDWLIEMNIKDIYKECGKNI